MAVPILAGNEVTVGRPEVLFEFKETYLPGFYEASPDGKRFLIINQEIPESARRNINITFNWFDEVRRLVALSKR